MRPQVFKFNFSKFQLQIDNTKRQTNTQSLVYKILFCVQNLEII